MDRRAFLTRMGTTFGALLGASALSGCAGLAAARRPDGGVDVEAYVAAMDAQVARIHALPDRPEVESLLAERDLPSGFFKSYMAGLFVVGAFRDLPAAIQKHPALQDRIWAEAPALGEAQLRLAKAFRALNAVERRELRAIVRDDREALEQVRAGILESAAGSQVAPERADQLGAIYDQVMFRLRKQDPALIIDEVVGKLARRAASAGAPEERWDELLEADRLETAALRAAASVEIAAARVPAEEAQLVALDDIGVSGPTVPDRGHQNWHKAWSRSTKAARLATTGLILMGLGLVLTAGGLVLAIGIGAYLAPIPTVGAILSIMGLVFLLSAATAAKRHRRRKKKAPERDDDSTWDR